MKLFLASLAAFAGMLANPTTGQDCGWREIAEQSIEAGKDFLAEWKVAHSGPPRPRERRRESA